MKSTRRRGSRALAKVVFVVTVMFSSRFATAAANGWSATSTFGAPSGRIAHTAIWTGSRMIVWGGAGLGDVATNTGGLFDPIADSWTPTSTSGAPSARFLHSAVWTGSKMIVWGGAGTGNVPASTGGVFDPTTNTWTATSTSGAPTARESHSAVWTGSKMIIWGGGSYQGAVINYLNTGAIYDPAADSWKPMSVDNAPSPRGDAPAVWTGSKFVVWGGDKNSTDSQNTGGVYDPEADSWSPTNANGAPTERTAFTGIWTGSEMILWGGQSKSGVPPTNTGGIYDPAADSWAPTSTTDAPTGREFHTAVWTGAQMIVWGGINSTNTPVNTGSLYDPDADDWTALPQTGAPGARYTHTAVWTGSSMIVWGGFNGSAVLSTGGIYTPAAAPCPEDGGRQCVAPVSAGTDAHSTGRKHPL